MHFRRLDCCPDLAEWWWVMMSSYLSKWDSNQRLEFEPQSHLNNPWPTSTVPFLRDFPNLRAMPQGLELLADSVLTPNYNVVRANPLYNLTPSTWNSLPDAWDYSARHGHQLFKEYFDQRVGKYDRALPNRIQKRTRFLFSDHNFFMLTKGRHNHSSTLENFSQQNLSSQLRYGTWPVTPSDEKSTKIKILHGQNLGFFEKKILIFGFFWNFS